MIFHRRLRDDAPKLHSIFSLQDEEGVFTVPKMNCVHVKNRFLSLVKGRWKMGGKHYAPLL
jgi:hypothetical protein